MSIAPSPLPPQADPRADTSEPERRDPPRPENRSKLLTLAVYAAIALVGALIVGAALAIKSVQRPAPRPTVQVVHVSGTAPVAAVDYLSVSAGIKPGPDGQLHDAFSQTTFHVHAGQSVRLVINNTDTAPHSIVSSGANVDIVVKPGRHTYILRVVHQGTFQWHCNLPCDPYSMAHMGYMMGTIIAS